jgi:hypothetical protein
MSSKFSSPALAILVTLLVSIPCSISAYAGLGVGLSVAASNLWHGVAAGPPVWLPMAYTRADFGVEYVTLLILLPLVLVALPAWLFHEITIANMAAPSDDRSTRLRVWTLVAGPFMTATFIACGAALKEETWFVIGEIGLLLTYIFVAFLFAGEPLGPSRRVEARWEREGAGAGRRFLGPGVMRACSVLFLLIIGSFAALLAAAALTLSASPDERNGVLALGGYVAAFLIFVAGFTAWTRSRSRASGVPRVLLLGALFLASVGPWIAMAIAGIFESDERALLIAAPSPFYALHLRKVIHSSSPDAPLVLMAGMVAAVAWALIGVGLAVLASSRVERRLAEERALRAGLEASNGGGA